MSTQLKEKQQTKSKEQVPTRELQADYHFNQHLFRTVAYTAAGFGVGMLSSLLFKHKAGMTIFFAGAGAGYGSADFVNDLHKFRNQRNPTQINKREGGASSQIREKLERTGDNLKGDLQQAKNKVERGVEDVSGKVAGQINQTARGAEEWARNASEKATQHFQSKDYRRGGDDDKDKDDTKSGKKDTQKKQDDSSLKRDIKEKATDLKNQAQQKASDIKDQAKQYAKDTSESLKKDQKDLKKEATDKAQNLKKEATDKAQNLKEKATDKAKDLKKDVQDKTKDMKDQASSLKKEATDKAQNLKKDFQDKTKDMKDQASSLKKDVTDKAKDMKDQAKQYVQEKSDSFKKDQKKDDTQTKKDQPKGQTGEKTSWNETTKGGMSKEAKREEGSKEHRLVGDMRADQYTAKLPDQTAFSGYNTPKPQQEGPVKVKKEDKSTGGQDKSKADVNRTINRGGQHFQDFHSNPHELGKGGELHDLKQDYQRNRNKATDEEADAKRRATKHLEQDKHGESLHQGNVIQVNMESETKQGFQNYRTGVAPGSKSSQTDVKL